jgi:hypothetical protein
MLVSCTMTCATFAGSPSGRHEAQSAGCVRPALGGTVQRELQFGLELMPCPAFSDRQADRSGKAKV